MRWPMLGKSGESADWFKRSVAPRYSVRWANGIAGTVNIRLLPPLP